MKNKLLFIPFALLFTSCSVTIVNAPKEIFIVGDENTAIVQGSDLKDNQAQQSSAFDWLLEIPFIK